MKKFLVILMACGMILAFGSMANAYVDTIEYPTGYFLDDDANKYADPYYRDQDEDWGWVHNAIGGTWTTATLSISAYDVDNYGITASAEHDLIYAYKGGMKTYIGELAGASDIWSYTTFDLDSSWNADIAAGLDVWMDIDTTSGGSWLVTLAKSVIALDGGTLPEPEPNPTVPEPATMLLLGFGLIGLAGLRRKI